MDLFTLALIILFSALLFLATRCIIIIFPTLTCVDSLEKTSVQSPPGELVGAGVVGVTELANITMMIMTTTSMVTMMIRAMTIMVIMMINTMIQMIQMFLHWASP